VRNDTSSFRTTSSTSTLAESRPERRISHAPGKSRDIMKTATTALKRAGRSLRHASTGPPSPAAIPAPQHLLSLADLSTSQMQTVLTSAAAYKVRQSQG
jgi:hypothetical protein